MRRGAGPSGTVSRPEYIYVVRECHASWPTLLRMRLPPGARVYLTTIVSLAGVALATWFGMQAGAAAPGRRWWTLGAVAASVTAAGVPAYEQIRKERMRAKAQRAAVDAAVAMRVLSTLRSLNGSRRPTFSFANPLSCR